MGNGFSELYDFCQTLEPKVSRKDIRNKVRELQGEIPKYLKTSLDLTISRGFFVSAKNPDCRFFKQIGGNAIVVARELNECWERFVYTKELMHVFDESHEFVNSGDTLKKLLNSFEMPSAIMDDEKTAFNSECVAFWRALCCLCPEKNRQEFLELYNKNHIDAYGIALQLRIPAQFIPSLFHENFLDIVKSIK